MARPLEERLAQKLKEVELIKAKIAKKQKQKPLIDELIFTKLLDVSKATYYNKKKNNSILLKLLKTYFTNYELEEYLEYGSIQKFELIKNIETEELKKLIDLKNTIKEIM